MSFKAVNVKGDVPLTPNGVDSIKGNNTVVNNIVGNGYLKSGHNEIDVKYITKVNQTVFETLKKKCFKSEKPS